MQLTTFIAETLKSGKMTISQNDREAVEINAQEKHIDINAKDKEFIKEIIAGTREGSTKKGVKASIQRGTGAIKTVRDMRPLVKEIVDDLCKEGVTVTISYKGR